MDKEQKAKEITEKLQEISQLQEMENLVQKNVIEFELEDKKYRIRKPTQKERSDANMQRMKKYHEMLQDENYLFEAQLIELYIKKGISIPTLQLELIEMKKNQDDLLLRLAPTTNAEDINKLKNEIIEIREKQNRLMLQISDLLQYSIEKQLNEFLSSYFLYLILEEEVNDKWEKVYKSYEEFLANDNEVLMIRGAYFLNLLVYNNVI